MDICSISQPGFEEVAYCRDPQSGLRAIIAIHSTRLGPALGGIRMFPYESDEAALYDVLRLAKAMTYKSAAAHLKLGGGKAVIIGDPLKDKSARVLKAMAAFIEHFQGKYVSAKDAGITLADLIHIADYTAHVTGLPQSMGGSDDPSPWTALSILEGIKTCVRRKLRRENLAGLKVAIQGAGHVGMALCGLLEREKAESTVSDLSAEAIDKAWIHYGIKAVAPERIFLEPADVFAPCAMGGIINDATVGLLNCKIVAGGANNQLEDEVKHGRILEQRGILYAPDFVINAGGVINIFVRDILKEPDPSPWIKKTGPFLEEIFDLAAAEKISAAEAANRYAERVLEAGVSF